MKMKTLRTTAAALAALLLGSGASAQLEYAGPKIDAQLETIEVEVAVIPTFRCVDGWQITSESEFTQPVCVGGVPAVCSYTHVLLLECQDGRFATIDEWDVPGDCVNQPLGTGEMCGQIPTFQEPTLPFHHQDRFLQR